MSTAVESLFANPAGFFVHLESLVARGNLPPEKQQALLNRIVPECREANDFLRRAPSTHRQVEQPGQWGSLRWVSSKGTWYRGVYLTPNQEYGEPSRIYFSTGPMGFTPPTSEAARVSMVQGHWEMDEGRHLTRLTIRAHLDIADENGRPLVESRGFEITPEPFKLMKIV